MVSLVSDRTCVYVFHPHPHVKVNDKTSFQYDESGIKMSLKSLDFNSSNYSFFFFFTPNSLNIGHGGTDVTGLRMAHSMYYVVLCANRCWAQDAGSRVSSTPKSRDGMWLSRRLLDPFVTDKRTVFGHLREGAFSRRGRSRLRLSRATTTKTDFAHTVSRDRHRRTVALFGDDRPTGPRKARGDGRARSRNGRRQRVAGVRVDAGTITPPASNNRFATAGSGYQVEDNAREHGAGVRKRGPARRYHYRYRGARVPTQVEIWFLSSHRHNLYQPIPGNRLRTDSQYPLTK